MAKLYDPHASLFRLSRSRIDSYVNCPRCFYLENKLGIKHPSMPGFSLNNAVDALLKKEFDVHRANGSAHPLMKAYGLDAVPLQHEKMDEWRESLAHGITYYHKPTKFFITGGVDDVWVNPDGEFIIVDYKSTSTTKEISLDDQYKVAYKRQMEIYQWLFRQNGFKVSPTGYFVYCNGDTDKEAFDGKLEFKIQLIPYEGKTEWIEETLMKIYACLQSDDIPEANPKCEYCQYTKAVNAIEVKVQKPQPVQQMLHV